MAHIALYRSWRPQSFREVVGQKHIIQTLQNSLREGRLTHAYLFSGPRGTGKTSVAKILAKAVNCEQGPSAEPCNQCQSCLRITEGTVMDVVEIDAASNRGVDEIRDLRDKVKYAPTEVRQKVYIIDEVHMLTTEAFNALLKTLEEPPSHVMFLLATTEPYRLPATIISRCQRFDFRRVPLEDQLNRLENICREEGVDAEKNALHYIARLSDGGMRDALSILDQIIAFAGSSITYENVLAITGGVASDRFQRLALSLKRRDAGQVLEQIDVLMQEGKSADKCLEQFIHYFRDLLMLKMVPDSHTMTEKISDKAALQEVANEFSSEELFQMIKMLNRYQAELKYVSQPQALLEIAMLKLCSPELSSSTAETVSPPAEVSPAVLQQLDQLAKRVEKLESKLAEALQTGDIHTGDTAAETKPTPRTRSAAQVASVSKAAARLDDFKAAENSSEFKQVAGRWNQVLSQLKQKNVSVYAWLVNGEPVSVCNDTVLVAFKNTIHRETTEKPNNKQMIEQVLCEQYNKTMKLATIMQKEWQEALEETAAEHREVLELVPEENTGLHKEEWINEAINLFGNDLVVIKDE